MSLMVLIIVRFSCIKIVQKQGDQMIQWMKLLATKLEFGI